MLLTVQEVCEQLKISRRTLANWERQGRIKRIKLGDRIIRYDQAEVDKFTSRD